MKYLDEEEFFHSREHRKSRKRSKTREEPKKTGILGRVLSVTGEGVVVEVEGIELLCNLKGLMKKEKKESSIVTVGDLVQVERETKRILHVEERHSFLGREDPFGREQQLIAANIDQVLIVTAIPSLKPTLIDRTLIAAELGNIHPIIVINKIDLLNEVSEKECDLYHQMIEAYEPLGIPLLSVSTRTGIGLENLRSLMNQKISAFAGQSGVGKSSLLNTTFGLRLQTGDLAQKTGKGSHTTTRARLLPLPHGGFCIDTPGIRSFGIWKIRKSDVMNHFREFVPYASECRYPDCTHLKEPLCAVQKALQEKRLSQLRFSSYQALMEELLEGVEQRQRKRRARDE